MSYFKLEREADGIGVLIIENPKQGAPNTISRAFVEGLEEILPTLETDRGLRALVVMSAKDDFLVGADLKEIEELETLAQVQEVWSRCRKVFDRFAALRYPTCAAINGNALGGGLEFALCFRYRVVSNDPQAKLALPEVKLGLIPGAGGTQRMPRRVGLSTALPLILNGSTIYPKKALKIGLADDAAHEGALRRCALELVRKDLANEPMDLVHPGVMDQLAGTGPGRKLLDNQSRKLIAKSTKGLFPAPFKALEAVLEGYALPLDEGLALEGRLFCPLVLDPVSRSLRHLHHTTVALKKRAGKGDGAKPRAVDQLGVVGCGFMGTGIAQVALDAGARVYARDVSPAAIGKAIAGVHKFLSEKAKKGQLKRHEPALIGSRLVGGEDFRGLAHADLVIEAVFEKLDLKQQTLAQIEEANQGRAIFASNTSSLSIAEIARHSRYPDRVVGMHFFSPVPKMPLLEVIETPQSSPEAVATAVAFGKRVGKHVIVVRDKIGFYTSRVIGAYMNEVAHLIVEGAAVEDIDRAVSALGFPVGPVQLMDEVGLDVGSKVGKILHDAYGDRLAPPAGWQAILTPGREGRKSGRGFYLYENGKRTGVDPSVYSTLPPRKAIPADVIGDRALYMFVAEALRCLEDGVLPGPVEGDVGAVFGIGFPPHLGGPFYFVDQRGAAAVVETLNGLAAKHGSRFAPPEVLTRLAAGNGRFYGAPVWRKE